jgi:hypothetical protein
VPFKLWVELCIYTDALISRVMNPISVNTALSVLY